MNPELVSPAAQPTVFFGPSRKRFQDKPAARHAALYLDATGLIARADPEARKLLEYAPDDEIESSFFSLVHSKNQYQVMRDVADMILHGKHAATWFFRLRTGRQRWQWYRAYAINELQQPNESICVRLSEATPAH